MKFGFNQLSQDTQFALRAMLSVFFVVVVVIVIGQHMRPGLPPDPLQRYRQIDRMIGQIMGVSESWDGSQPHSSYYTIESTTTTGARDIAIVEPAAGPNVVSVTTANWLTELQNNAANKIFVFEPGTYNNFTFIGNSINLQNGNVFLCKDGVIFDGNDTAWGIIPETDKTDVQIINCTIQNYADSVQFDKEYKPTIYGGERWIIVGNTFTNNGGALNMGWNHYLANGSRIADNVFDNNRWHSANNGGNGIDIVWEYNTITNTAVNNPDASSCMTAGGDCFCWYGTFKIINDINGQPDLIWDPSDGWVLLQNNYFDSNVCAGLWLDVNVQYSLIRNNVIKNSINAGVAVELSYESYVVGNTFENNGYNLNQSPTEYNEWQTIGVGQTSVFNSPHTYVYGNTMTFTEDRRWASMGNICEEYRMSSPASIAAGDLAGGRDVQFKGNTIISTTGTNHILAGVMIQNDCGGGPSTTQFACNKYVINDSDRLRYRWGTSWNYSGNFTWMQGQGQEVDSFVTTNQADAFPAQCQEFADPALATVASPTPTPTPSDTPTPSPTPSDTPTPTPEPTPTPTNTPTPSPEPTPTPTNTPTPSPEPTPTPTNTPTPLPPTPTPTNTPTPSPTPTNTPTPSPTPTATPENTATPTPTPENTSTPTPTPANTSTPTPTPTPTPTTAAVGGTNVVQTTTVARAPEPPRCTSPVPFGVPDLFQISRFTNGAWLYFSPANDNVEGYHVVFGYSEGDERFGGLSMAVTPDANKGVQAIYVQSLNPRHTYWFKVLPYNQCATGTWSNWLQSPPITGFRAIFYRYFGR